MPHTIWVDITRCINCRSCEVACEREHSGRANIFVQLIDERYAVPLNCRQCSENPCIAVCPTGAIHRQDEDSVIIAHMKCIGCGMCKLACPFGSIWMDSNSNVARKCDLCIHRREKGLEPACVATCSARARVFGDFEELLEISRARGGHIILNRACGKYGTIVTLPATGSDIMETER